MVCDLLFLAEEHFQLLSFAEPIQTELLNICFATLFQVFRDLCDQFANDTKLGGVAVTPEGCAA